MPLGGGILGVTTEREGPEMATTTRRRTSPAQREAKIAAEKALMDQLAEFTEEIDEDELVQAKIAIWAQRYSERNAVLIVMQAPDATELRGYQDWRAQGRQVRKGEKGIRILAPAGQSAGTEATPATEAAPATDGKPGRQFFRLISVFDVAQTDEIPVEVPDLALVSA